MLKLFKDFPLQWLPYIVLLFAITLMIIVSWGVGTIVSDLHDFILEQVEIAETRNQELRDDIQELLEELR